LANAAVYDDTEEEAEQEKNEPSTSHPKKWNVHFRLRHG
jgi:hypothetical protein